MSISDWVLDMEDKGEIELVETNYNYHLGWVYNDTGQTVTITGHEYVPVKKEQVNE
jgi:roadblock/LC7 domain-containing protein